MSAAVSGEIVCPNQSLGCPASFANETEVSAHKDECPYQIISCRHCGAGEIPRRHMISHAAHECSGDKCDCPNDCRNANGEVSVISRSGVSAHRLVCPNELIRCPLCSIEYARSADGAHQSEYVVKHVTALIEENRRLRLTIADMKANSITFGTRCHLLAAHSGKCLDVDNGSHKDGIKVQQWECFGLKCQTWVIAPLIQPPPGAKDN